ncbi:MAG: RNA-directed DNA polymerase [Planctomycetaceae bacterium]|nr:RNA-directed DNA polymerase [Planctomycetaceae bacterium]
MLTIPVLIGIAVVGGLAILIGMIVGTRQQHRSDDDASAPPAGNRPATESPSGNVPQRDTSTASLTLTDLSARIGISVDDLQNHQPVYREVRISKPHGGVRCLEIPDDRTKELQRTLLHRLFAGIRAHNCACGFEAGTSIVNAAVPHVRKRVIVKLDVRRFFESTTAKRVSAWFRSIGWDDEATAVLTQLTTHNGHLPQGAPTSPRLSNLVNAPLDEGLLKLATHHGGDYTRYADDITMSFHIRSGRRIRGIIQATRRILRSYGYKLHGGRKQQILRRHQRQQVLGLVVNDQAALPRHTRRRLRAIRHRTSQGIAPTLTPAQLEGWEAFRTMVETQRQPSSDH